MTEWSKEQLEEMFGDDVAEQLAFLAGCYKHRLSNDPVIPDGWIVSDEVLRKFAELIVRECCDILMKPGYAMNRSTDLSEYNEGWVNGRLLGIHHIREHFGVEE